MGVFSLRLGAGGPHKVAACARGAWSRDLSVYGRITNICRTLISEVGCQCQASPTPCQLPKQRRSLARTAARSTSWCASKRMRLCLTSSLRVANVAGRFMVARAGSFSNTSWWIVQVERLLGGSNVTRLLRVHQSRCELMRVLDHSGFRNG